MRAARRALLVMTLLLQVPAAGRAQNLQVTGIQGVTFGAMLPGVSKVVSRSDGLNGARFDIKGAGNSRIVQLQFALPAALSGPGGATLPLSYTAGDAGFSAQQSIGNQIGFDPRLPFVATLSGPGRGSVFLGCRANPAANQAAGSYSATLTLTVTYLP